MKHFTWYWQIASTGSGPNYYLSLTFNTPKLAFQTRLRDFLSVDYILKDGDRPVWHHRDNRTSGYLIVTELINTTLVIELGWGLNHNATDQLIQQLLSPPYDNQLTAWQVYAGGQGYAEKKFAQGNNVASFLDYCHCSTN
ncbi:MAG: hypothetical protein AAFY17_04220 [Cyanobacteria bacterium J06642_11]